MKHNTQIFTVGAILLLALTGCGTAGNQTGNTGSAANTANSSTMNMGNMTMANQTAGTSTPSGLTQAFQDELNGFSTIETDVKKGDFTHATTLANNLHDEFHAAILPALKAKKGNAYAEDVHSKYDALQDAINGKNHAQIHKLIQVNRANLYSVANILGVSLK